MEDTDLKRKLATILVADIVGYSRLTANDEDWTIRALGNFRKIVDGIIQRHDGRIFSTGGDSVLAEFASPVEAVRCAVDFQEASRSRNLLQQPDRQLRYRIGINLGDVMVRGTDLLGDGVNVAARLEGIAEPGGICVSATVWEHINGKLSIGYVDIGEQAVKNIPRPVRAYHLRVDGTVGAVVEPPHAPATTGAPATGGKTAVRKSPMPLILAGAGVIIAVLAALLAWQMWPKPTPGPVASAPITPAAPTPAPAKNAPAGAITIPPAPASLPFKDALTARLLALLPSRNEAWRTDTVNNYLSSSGHKAMAASLDPPGIWRPTGRQTADNAQQAALEECQVVYGNPCRPVAVDETLSPAPNAPRDMPSVRYSGDFDPAQIPGLHLEHRDRPDIVGYAKAAGPKAAAYNADGGRVFTVTGAASQRAAEEQALKQCVNDANGKLAAPCLLYASDQRVVLPLRLKEPMTPAAVATSTAPPPAPAATPAPAPQPVPTPSATASGSPKTFRDCPNCPEMVVVPAGSFQMGAAPGENQRYEVPSTQSSRGEPQHQVTFAKPFALGKYDVTRGEFAAFVAATNFHPRPGCQGVVGNSWVPQPQANWENPGFTQDDRQPVVCMNEIEINAYLSWLRQKTGKDYRLPSEAEWEYAERGGTTTAFYWGDDAKDGCAYENLGDQTYGDKYAVKGAIPCRDGFGDMAPVGSFKPNPFGLYDMAGNVFVLLADCWNENYTGAPTDGSAWTSGDCARHVARKASFGNPHAWIFRSANRESEGGLVRRNRFSFRVALSQP